MIEHILACQPTGIAIDPEVARFLGDLPDRLRSRYEQAGLLGAQADQKKSAKLNEYLDAYFESIQRDVKPSTWVFYNHTRKRLNE